MTKKKPIDQKYLLETLKSFNTQVLQKIYATPSDIEELEQSIKEFIEKIELPSGKNVQVAKIEPIIGGNRVTFVYYDDANEQQTSSMEIMNGDKGVSVVNANVDEENVLTLELSDGRTIVAGQIIVDLSGLTLEDYYTKKQADDKFIQKINLNELIQNYLNSNFKSIELEEIKNIFRKDES